VEDELRIAMVMVTVMVTVMCFEFDKQERKRYGDSE